jgi:hypothetical protein
MIYVETNHAKVLKKETERERERRKENSTV